MTKYILSKSIIILLFVKIISNTTIQRPEAVKGNPVAEETGGLSGKPLLSLSTDILKDMYILTKVLSLKMLSIRLLKRSPRAI